MQIVFESFWLALITFCAAVQIMNVLWFTFSFCCFNRSEHNSLHQEIQKIRNNKLYFFCIEIVLRVFPGGRNFTHSPSFRCFLMLITNSGHTYSLLDQSRAAARRKRKKKTNSCAIFMQSTNANSFHIKRKSLIYKEQKQKTKYYKQVKAQQFYVFRCVSN